MSPTITIETKSGRTVTVRGLQREDAPLLEAMFYRLSSETRWRRFFVPLDNLDRATVQREARRLATLDPAREVALLAFVDEGESQAAIAVARYVRTSAEPAAAEASIVVRDDFQNQGVGRQLFDLLVQTALVQGFAHLTLLTQADNLGVLALVQQLGIPYRAQFSDGLYEIDLQLQEGQLPHFVLRDRRT
jgi:GNAT superfamily N-acetyltransferase